MINIIIRDFPLAPSVNATLMPVMDKIKYNKWRKPYASGRMIKTKEYMRYESQCIAWALRYHTALGKLKNEIILRRQDLRRQGKELTLKIEFYAVFHRSRIFTVNDLLEKIDSDNRLKPAKDVLFKTLCLDDKHVFKDEIEKITGDKEHMIVRITEFAPRTESEIKNLLGI